MQTISIQFIENSLANIHSFTDFLFDLFVVFFDIFFSFVLRSFKYVVWTFQEFHKPNTNYYFDIVWVSMVTNIWCVWLTFTILIAKI